MPPRATVLDIGCGDGSLAATLMRKRADLSVIGVDVLVRPNPQIVVQAFDGAHLPFADASVDVAMLVDVLHHADDPIALLSEARRVARRIVVLKDHTLCGLAARATLSLMDWVGNVHQGVRLTYNYWTPRQWHDAFTWLHLEVRFCNPDLSLYPRPFTWIFDRRLHFIAVLVDKHGIA